MVCHHYSSAQTPRLLYVATPIQHFSMCGMLPHPLIQTVLSPTSSMPMELAPSHRRHASFHTIKYLLTTSGATLIHPCNNTHIHHFHCFMHKCVPLHSMYLLFLTHLPGSRQHSSRCYQFTQLSSLLYKLTHHFYAQFFITTNISHDIHRHYLL